MRTRRGTFQRNSLEPPSVLFARASKEFFVPSSARNAQDEKKREREKGKARRGGHQCANSISPLLVPNLRLRRRRSPHHDGPRRGDGARWALPAPAIPIAPPVFQEGPTVIDPDLHAPNERDCQRKPTCRTRTCGNAVLRCPSRFPWPPVSLVSSMLPRRDPPALPSSFSCSPNLPNRATAQLEHPDSLFSLRLPSFLPSRVPRFTRVHTGHVEG